MARLAHSLLKSSVDVSSMGPRERKSDIDESLTGDETGCLLAQCGKCRVTADSSEIM